VIQVKGIQQTSPFDVHVTIIPQNGTQCDIYTQNVERDTPAFPLVEGYEN